MKQFITALAMTFVMALGVIGLVGAATATPGPDHKESVCHPVEGRGETGTGWNIIPPDKASKHIDDNGKGKHTRKDGRTDVYAINGVCPGGTTPTTPVTTPTTASSTPTSSSTVPTTPTTTPTEVSTTPTSPVTSATTEPPRETPPVRVDKPEAPVVDSPSERQPVEVPTAVNAGL